MPEAMKKKMKEMGAHMDSSKAMEMAKKMGADPEALKKMEAKMNASKGDKPEADKAKGHVGHDGRHGEKNGSKGIQQRRNQLCPCTDGGGTHHPAT